MLELFHHIKKIKLLEQYMVKFKGEKQDRDSFLGKLSYYSQQLFLQF
jgi:hypothetical protein